MTSRSQSILTSEAESSPKWLLFPEGELDQVEQIAFGFPFFATAQTLQSAGCKARLLRDISESVKKSSISRPLDPWPERDFPSPLRKRAPGDKNFPRRQERYTGIVKAL